MTTQVREIVLPYYLPIPKTNFFMLSYFVKLSNAFEIVIFSPGKIRRFPIFA